jgi:hypothetical protein
VSWVKKLLARFRRPPRLVVEFRRYGKQKQVGVRLSAVGTDTAEAYELKAMAVVLLALEHGAFQLSREQAFAGPGMDNLWKNACELGCVMLAESGKRI